MTTSGMVRIDRLQGENVEVELQIVEEPFAQFTRLVPKSPYRTPFRYAETSKSVVKKTVRFNPDYLIKEIPIGGPPYIDDKTNGILVKGNYGIVYDLHLELVNNTDSYEKVELFFSRISGMARCVLILDDQLVDAKHFSTNTNHNPERLYTFTLRPKSTAHHTLILMPQPGGFYPASLVLRRGQFIEGKLAKR